MRTTRRPARNASTRFRRRSSASIAHSKSRVQDRSSTVRTYSLVDAAYAPFLQRYYFLDRIRPIGLIERYPRLKAWAETLMKRPSTHSFPEAEFEALYRANVKRRKKWLSQFIADVAVAAE